MIETWLGHPIARQLVDRAFGAYARLRAARTQAIDFAKNQSQTLLRLTRQAAQTQFGRAHGFGSIRTIDDYQRQVPLRRYEDFWRDYWQPAFPALVNITWPGAIPYFAQSSGTTSGVTKRIPVTAAMLASNRRAALTALAWFRAAHPTAPLFTGKLCFLGGSTALAPLCAAAAAPRAGDLSGIIAATAPRWMRPFSFPPQDLALLDDWETKLDRLARAAARENITMVSGVPSWLVLLFERLRDITGRETIAEIWPELRLVIHGGVQFDGYRSLFHDLIGSDAVRYFETYPASEGFVAAEDLLHRRLRLIPQHDIFYEFVPVDELERPQPPRHTVADITPGVQYAVVLTTCAGLWSYVLGDTICFESREPPRFRFTGRTAQFLSAFGEHLIGEEIEAAVAAAARATAAQVLDFHIGPIFPDARSPIGRHLLCVEFAAPPDDLERFRTTFDATLAQRNADYSAHRQGDVSIGPPELRMIPRGGFAAWLKARGQLGGQHKVPRIDNSGVLTAELARRCAAEPSAVASSR